MLVTFGYPAVRKWLGRCQCHQARNRHKHSDIRLLSLSVSSVHLLAREIALLHVRFLEDLNFKHKSTLNICLSYIAMKMEKYNCKESFWWWHTSMQPGKFTLPVCYEKITLKQILHYDRCPNKSHLRFEDDKTDVKYGQSMSFGLWARDWRQVSRNIRIFGIDWLFQTVSVTSVFLLSWGPQCRCGNDH